MNIDIRKLPYRVYYGNRLLIGAIGTALICLATLIILIENTIAIDHKLSLVVLNVLLTVVSLFPVIVSMWLQAKRFDLFHPLFYAAWFFFLPQFVLPTLLFMFGNLETFSAQLLPDPWAARVKAVELAILGSIGLSIGYLLPIGRRIGGLIPRFKALDSPSSKVQLSAALLLLIGLFTQAGAFREGLFGYQFRLTTSIWGATFASLAQLSTVGQAMIWYSYFRMKRGWRLLALGCVALFVLGVIASGSRGALFHSVLVIVAGYQYAQRKLLLRKLWRWGVLALVSLLFGMIFGTYFRLIKTEFLGRTTSMSVSDLGYVSQQAFDTIRAQSLAENLTFGWDRIAERMDGITSLGVILSFADRLKADEVVLGINGNIIRDFATAFVPRFLWPSKPVVGVSEQIGNLYFHIQYSSPATTYMGDLYRNFGILGVLPGMLILGITLRGLYAWLIERQTTTPLRVGLFLVLAWTVNYESLYSTYYPALIRAFFISLVAVVLVRILGQFSRKTQ